MRYIDLLTLRQRSIKDRFLTKITATPEQKQDFSKLLESLAKEADKDLLVQLRTLFGNEEADRIMAKKNQAEYTNL